MCVCVVMSLKTCGEKKLLPQCIFLVCSFCPARFYSKFRRMVVHEFHFHRCKKHCGRRSFQTVHIVILVRKTVSVALCDFLDELSDVDICVCLVFQLKQNLCFQLLGPTSDQTWSRIYLKAIFCLWGIPQLCFPKKTHF